MYLVNGCPLSQHGSEGSEIADRSFIEVDTGVTKVTANLPREMNITIGTYIFFFLLFTHLHPSPTPSPYPLLLPLLLLTHPLLLPLPTLSLFLTHPLPLPCLRLFLARESSYAESYLFKAAAHAEEINSIRMEHVEHRVLTQPSF